MTVCMYVDDKLHRAHAGPGAGDEVAGNLEAGGDPWH